MYGEIEYGDMGREFLNNISFATKGVVICALFFMHAHPALANPEGGVVTSGSATITGSGNKVDIHQSSNKAVIDWRSFDIAPDEHTQFHQPSSSSMTLNRINSGSPTQILGKLTANGNIMILNGSGVLFGAGAQVDVNGLVATTAGISNNKFMKDGPLHFDQKGKSDAAIINNGTITAKEAGLVGLVAPNVSNNGLITAKLGKVHLASADEFTMDLYGDGLMAFKVGDDVKKQLVSNKGKIEAAGGTIAMTAAAGRDVVDSLIEVSGELKAPAVSTKNGKIFIHAAGSNAVAGNVATDKGKKSGSSTVIVDGKLDVSGKDKNEKGGAIDILGDTVALLSGTDIDASGTKGGGTARIGGDYYGGGETPTALNLFVEKDVKVKADAIEKGNGGRITFWADNSTTFYGDVSARGGAKGGDGGFVEVSGKQYLKFRGTVDTRADNGNVGTLLLDPADLVIMSGSGDSAADGTATFSFTGGTGVLAGADGASTLYETELEGIGATTSISVTVTNSITINDLADNLLDLKQTGVRTVTFTAGAGGITMLDTNDTIKTGGGGLTFSTTGAATLGNLNSGAGALGLTVGADSNVYGTISGTGALLTKAGAGKLYLHGNNTYTGGTALTAGRLVSKSNTAFGTGAVTLTSSGAIGVEGGARSFANAINISSTSAALYSDSDVTFTGNVTNGNNNYSIDINSTGLTTFNGTYFNLSTSGTTGRTFDIGGAGEVIINSIVRNGGSATTSTLRYIGTNTLTLNGANLHATTQQVGGSTATIIGTTATAFGSNLTLGNGTVYSDVANINLTSIGLAGSSSVTLGGSANYTAGTMTGNNGNRLLTFNGTGTLTITGFTNISSDGTTRTMTLGGSGNIVLQGVVRNGPSAASGNLIWNGSGSLSLLGNNTYSGATTANTGGGRIILGSNTAFGTSTVAVGAGLVTLESNGSPVTIGNTVNFSSFSIGGNSDLTFTGTLTNVLAGNPSITINNTGKTTFGNIALSNSATGRTLTFAGNGNTDINGVISNGGAGAGQIIKNGSGTLTYLGANTYTGLTTINGGTIAYGADNAIASGGITLNNGATLDIGSYSDTAGIITLNNGNILGTTGRLSSNSSFNFNTGVVSANLGGTAPIMKLSGGDLTLSGDNTHSGGNAFSVGVVLIGSDTAFGSGVIAPEDATLKAIGGPRSISNTVNIGEGAIFDGDEDITFTGTLNGAGGTQPTVITFNGTGSVYFGDINISLSTTNKSMTFTGSGNVGVTGVIANGGGSLAGSIIKSGSGTLTLSGNSTYGGLTTINGGTLAYGSDNALGSGGITIDGGTLDIGSYSDTVGAVTLVSGNISGTTGVLTGTSYAVENGTISASLGGTGSMTKTTGGTVNLSGTNTFTGGTTVTNGYLTLNGGNALADNGEVALHSTGTIEMSEDERIGDLAGSGTIIINNKTLTFGTANDANFDGVITGNGNLVKLGSGRAIFSGNNTLIGTLTLSEGYFVMDANDVFTTDLAIAADSGTFLDFGGYSTCLKHITSDGAVIFGSGATITTDGSQIYNGDILASDLTLISQGGGNIEAENTGNDFMGTLSINTAGSVSVYDSDEITLGNISGEKIFITASGDLVLSGQIVSSSIDDDAIVLITEHGAFLNQSADTGDALKNTAGGKWLVYSSSPADDDRNGLIYDFKQYNAAYADPLLGTGNGFIYKAAPVINVSLTGLIQKTYDGTTTASIDLSNYNITGAIDNDDIVLSLPSIGTFDSANAGNGKTVSVNGLSLSSVENNGAMVYGYQLASTGPISAAIGKIGKAAITISTSDVVRGYNGTTAAAGNAVITSGTLYNNASNGGALDSISGGAFAFTNANAGTGNKTVTVSGVTVNDGNGGGNYNVTYAANTTSTISRAALSIKANDAVKNYSDNLVFAGNEFTTIGTLYNTDGVTSVTLNSAGAAAGSPASGGPYSIVASNAAGSGLSNYDITYLDGQLTINGGAPTPPSAELPATVVWTSQNPITAAPPAPTTTGSATPGTQSGESSSESTGSEEQKTANSNGGEKESTEDENGGELNSADSDKNSLSKRLNGLLKIHPVISKLFKI